MKRSPLLPWLFVAPALAVVLLTVLVPALMALVMSFTRTGLDLDAPLQFIGLANLRRLSTDPLFLKVLSTTFLYLLGVVPPMVAGSLGLAVLLNRALPGIHWLRGAFYTPVLVSVVVAAIAFRWIYAENGLLNGWAGFLLGNNYKAIGFLSDPKLALIAVMFVTLWKGIGYYMVIFLAGLQGISKDLYEAAELDGSRGWRQHLDITLPLMRPYVALVAVISSIAATKVFEEVFLLTQGGPADSTRTVVYYVYDLAFQELDISYACAAGLALFLVVLLLSLLQQGLKGSGLPKLQD
ncbi:carbohydrate ABC transporter permease [Synechococcus lacustris]|uniref:carbohydrate ABC transporter permease n=1 Tax=Synechococcus lacustris TaxID=2116544 RepID=UPI0020CD3A43|nr:sugar ABC transporter permease [Synechococcus lacustris]